MRCYVLAMATLAAAFFTLLAARHPLEVGSYPNRARPNSWWWDFTWMVANWIDMTGWIGVVVIAIVGTVGPPEDPCGALRIWPRWTIAVCAAALVPVVLAFVL
jgi:hypothetical protein